MHNKPAFDVGKMFLPPLLASGKIVISIVGQALAPIPWYYFAGFALLSILASVYWTWYNFWR
jgi:hypothetical protein